MRFPLSNPPPKPDKPNWWLTAPGIMSIFVIIGGLLFLVCGLAGGLPGSY